MNTDAPRMRTAIPSVTPLRANPYYKRRDSSSPNTDFGRKRPRITRIARMKSRTSDEPNSYHPRDPRFSSCLIRPIRGIRGFLFWFRLLPGCVDPWIQELFLVHGYAALDSSVASWLAARSGWVDRWLHGKLPHSGRLASRLSSFPGPPFLAKGPRVLSSGSGPRQRP